MNFDNLTFESVVTALDGKEYTTCVRELQSDDCNRITQIVRNYSENATILLYATYRKNKEETVKNIKDSELDRVLGIFESLDKQYWGDIDVLKADENTKRRLMDSWGQFIASFPDDELFSPYGPIQAPFTKSVTDYIEKAGHEQKKSPREIYRMGIEIEGNLIGGFVFDFIKQKIGSYMTIGDIGVYTEKTGTARRSWRHAIYPAIYFIDTVVKGYEDKGENLYISATTHLCNMETQNFFSPEKGFIELGNNISTAYGPRRKFVCKYSDFIEKFLPPLKKLKIKITNTLVDGEINWSQMGNT